MDAFRWLPAIVGATGLCVWHQTALPVRAQGDSYIVRTIAGSGAPDVRDNGQLMFACIEQSNDEANSHSR